MERTYSTPLIDKLGVRPGGRVAIVGSVDPDGSFHELLAERTDDVTDGEPLPDTDLVFLAADSVPELSYAARSASRAFARTARSG